MPQPRAAARPPRRTPSDPPHSVPGRLVLGLQPVREAIRVHGSRVARVAVDRKQSPRLDALARFARDQGVPQVARVPRAELDRASAGVTHQGAAAWAPDLELVGIDALTSDPGLLAVALDGVQDPQNFGAVVRSAVALAGAAVLWGEHSSAPLSPAMFRASAGAVEHARLCRVPSLTSALQEAADRTLQVVGLDARAATRLRDVDLTQPTILVVGSEYEGLARSVRRVCSVQAFLVPPRGIESLNASVAAAVALYEASVQRLSSDG